MCFLTRPSTPQTQVQAGQVGRTLWPGCKDSRGTQAGLSEGPGTVPAARAPQVLPPGTALGKAPAPVPDDGGPIVPPPGSSEGPAPWGQVSELLGAAWHWPWAKFQAGGLRSPAALPGPRWPAYLVPSGPLSPQDQRTTLLLAEPHCPLVVAPHSCTEALTRVHSASPCTEQLRKQHKSHSTGTAIDGP